MKKCPRGVITLRNLALLCAVLSMFVACSDTEDPVEPPPEEIQDPCAEEGATPEQCAPVFQRHPQDATAIEGTNAAFAASVGEHPQDVEWVWEVQALDEGDWTRVEGQTSERIEILADEDLRVRARVNDSNGFEAVSNIAELHLAVEIPLPAGVQSIQGANITVEQGAHGLWAPETQAADRPPALQHIDLNNIAVTDPGGNRVLTRYVDNENENPALELLFVQRDEKHVQTIAPGIYHYALHNEDDPDEIISEGAFEIQHVDQTDQDAHEGDGKTFLLSGVSIHVESPQSNALSTIDLRDYQRRPVAPIHVEEAERFVRHDYLILSQVIYRYTVETELAGYAPIRAEVYSPVRGSDRFRNHRHEGGALTLTFRVPHGADFSLHEKRTRHYEEFLDWNATLDPEQSDQQTDVYVAVVPKGRNLHYEAGIPGVTIKRAQMIRPTASQSFDVDLPLIDPADVGAQGFMEASLLHSAGPSSVLALSTEHPALESLPLDMMRVWQAMEGVTANYFIEPNFYFDVYGTNIALEEEGAAGRRRQRVHALDQGVSVITFGYEPILVHQNNNDLFFTAIDPKNLGTIVVQVDEQNVDNIDLHIEATEFDTFYYTAAQGAAPFTFSPTADKDLEVCVHAPLSVSTWGDGWDCYDPNQDESYTVDLIEGRNIVRASTENSAQYYVLNAGHIEILIDDEEEFQAGEPIRMTILGLQTPVPKLSGIYNPGFGGLVWSEYVLKGEAIRSKTTQYAIAEGSVLEITVDEPGTYTLENGRIHCAILGSGPGTHRHLRLTGYAPNFNAGSPSNLGPYYGALPDITFEVH